MLLEKGLNYDIIPVYQHMLLKNSALSGIMYSRTSVAQTSLGQWKFVGDMGSSSHCGLIIAPG